MDARPKMKSFLRLNSLTNKSIRHINLNLIFDKIPFAIIRRIHCKNDDIVDKLRFRNLTNDNIHDNFISLLIHLLFTCSKDLEIQLKFPTFTQGV